MVLIEPVSGAVSGTPDRLRPLLLPLGIAAVACALAVFGVVASDLAAAAYELQDVELLDESPRAATAVSCDG